MSLDLLMQMPQYSLPQAEKERLLLAELNALTRHHRMACGPYEKLLRVMHGNPAAAESLQDVPYVPVGLYKSHELRSIRAEQVFKTLTSSGTAGQEVSRIYLDRETAQRQTKALSRIIGHVLGRERLPMILIESPGLIKDRLKFSARGAGTLGMMNFGHHHFYALDENMNLDLDGLGQFLARFGSKPFLLFGFTFMVWQYFLRRIQGAGTDLSNGILFHSGGWKKLQEVAVGNEEFQRHFRDETGLARIYNFYGMVEQVGSVFLEGEDGYLYPPNFADIVVREPQTWEPVANGEPGVIQVLSALPLSYPGHSILTEDMGVIHGVDDSTCGRKGKRFSVLGRVPKTELRGCSDVHAAGSGSV